MNGGTQSGDRSTSSVPTFCQRALQSRAHIYPDHGASNWTARGTGCQPWPHGPPRQTHTYASHIIRRVRYRPVRNRDRPRFKPQLCTTQLCGLGQVTQPLWTLEGHNPACDPKAVSRGPVRQALLHVGKSPGWSTLCQNQPPNGVLVDLHAWGPHSLQVPRRPCGGGTAPPRRSTI